MCRLVKYDRINLEWTELCHRITLKTQELDHAADRGDRHTIRPVQMEPMVHIKHIKRF